MPSLFSDTLILFFFSWSYKFLTPPQFLLVSFVLLIIVIVATVTAVAVVIAANQCVLDLN